MDSLTDTGTYAKITDEGIYYAANSIPAVAGGDFDLTLNSGVDLRLNDGTDWVLNS